MGVLLRAQVPLLVDHSERSQALREGGRAWEAWIRFEVTSEQREDVSHMLADIRALVHEVGLILVSKQRL